MKPKTVAGLIIAKRKPDGGKEEMHSEGNENHALEAASEELIRAVNAKDSVQLASVIRDIFEICQSYSDDEEGPEPEMEESEG